MTNSLTVEQALAQAKKAIRQRRFAEAAALYESILTHKPNHPIAKKGLRKLQRSGRPLSDEPAAAEIDNLVARLNAREFSAVEKACRQRLRAMPRSLLLRNLLGVALQRSGNVDAAIEVLDALLADKPEFADAHLNRGVALRDAGRLADAAAAYEKSLALNPQNALASYNLANVYKDLGEFDRAATSYEQAISLAPDFPQAHRNLAAIREYEPGDPHLAQMESAWQRSEGSARAELGFALASVEERLGNFEQSFAYLEEANQLRRAELGYAIEDDEALFARIRTCEIGEPPVHESADKRPIFIVGMMRSGTSLVEQILASHGSVHGGGELETLNRLIMPRLLDPAHPDDFSEAEVAALRMGYLEELGSLDARESIVTDKMPLNFRWLGFVTAALPEARIVHVSRDPRATCWSIYKHFFADEGNPYAWDMRDIAAYHGLYLDLMAHWHGRFPDRIHELSYEELTDDQEGETRRLLEFCELDWDPACLEFHKTKRAVTTSSAAQVRKAMYKGSSEAWRNYESHISPLLDALDSQMSKAD